MTVPAIDFTTVEGWRQYNSAAYRLASLRDLQNMYAQRGDIGGARRLQPAIADAERDAAQLNNPSVVGAHRDAPAPSDVGEG